MADSYKPTVFFEALAKVIQQKKLENLVFRFVGSVPASVREKLSELGITSEFIGHVAHNEAVRYMQSTNLLLLVIPDAPGAEGILTGKLFEYLGAGKRIIGIGPSNGDAATILKECNAGVMFDRSDKNGLLNFLSDEITTDNSNKINSNEVKRYTRRQLTNQLSTIISNL